MGTDRKRVLILLNDSAGIGKAGLNTWMIVKKFAQHGFEPVVYPIIPGTDLVSEKLIAEYDGNTDILLCSGGDGTLNHVVQAILDMEKKPVIAYLPSGSTNDFAKAHRIPSEFEKALEIAVKGNIFRYDVGRLNNRIFNYVAAFGAFSAVSYATDQQLKNTFGHLAYVLSVFTDLDEHIHYSRHLQIEADDEFIEDDFVFGAVCNSTNVAGFTIFKDSDVILDDGKMEMLLVKAPKAGSPDLQGILNVLQKGPLEHPLLTFKHVSKIRITSDDDVAWTVDGEFGGSYKETLIQVAPRAVSIMDGSQ